MKLDGKSIQAAMMQLVEEYKLDPYQVLEVIRNGIKSGFKKDFPEYRKAEVLVNIENDGTISIYKALEVVEEIENEDTQILLAEAKEERKDISVGEQLLINITPAKLELSRIAAQAAAQTIKQGIKNIERERFYEKFQDKEEELLKAKVLRVHSDSIILDIDGTTVVLPPESQIPNRVYEIGEEVFVYLKKISRDTGGIVLDITQSSPDYVEAILKKIVPEFESGAVQIDNIARIAGKKTKILVSSTQDGVDAVGVMVGHKGDRINTVLSLLDGEKVDFVQNTEDPTQLIIGLLKPAQVEEKNVEFKPNGKVVVKIDESQKPLAIGKGASNIKLASQLSGYQ
ncbi:MAG: transcription termination factor NusA, partial [candidate division SR1 bacterium]|nr:transcription termination factor NusA [candidate division SR1 bacterium]